MRIPITGGLLTLCLIAFSCHLRSGQSGSNADFDGQIILGTYQGSFGTGIITMVFNYVNGNIVSGYEIHKGIRRNINGTMTEEGGELSLKLKEPGNYVMDGSFVLMIDTSAMKITGTWNPFKKDQSPEKKLSLSPYVSENGNMPYDIFGDWRQINNSKRNAEISFMKDGYCEYTFYEVSEDSTRTSADSTKQQQLVKGTYIYSGNVYKIEWQRNSYTPAQQMTLTIKRVPIEGMETPDTISRLVGNGWEFEITGD